jgi:hypothetical protein
VDGVVSAVFHMFQYFQELLPGGDVAVSAVNRFSRNSHLWMVLYLLFFTCSNISINSHLWVMLLYLLLFTGSNISRNFYLGVMLLYLLLFTCSNISRDLLGGVVVSAVAYRFQYFQGLFPGGNFVVSAVVYRCQYVQELSSSGGVVVSAVVHRFQYFLGFLSWGCCICYCSRSNISRDSYLGVMLLYLLLFTGIIISRNSHLRAVLLYLMLFTGSNISRNSHLGWWCLSAVFTCSNISRDLLGVGVVSAVVHMFQYFQGLLPGVMLLYLLWFTGSNISRNSHLVVVLLYLLLFTGSNISWNSHLGVMLLYLLLFTCSNTLGTLTFGWCCCICCCSHVPIFTGTPTWG